MATLPLVAQEVKPIETALRRIRTPFPPKESIPILEKLRTYEPASLSGQPPVIWHRAEGFTVEDRFGNRWIDWSSGVLVTNAGHGRKEIIEGITEALKLPLLHNYCFPSEWRARLAEKLALLSPIEPCKVFLLTTGSETVECAIKLARTYGRKAGGDRKLGIVTYSNAFHGRTMGAQMAGGIPALKQWIGNIDPDMHNVDFPDGFRCKDTSFELFEKTLEKKGVTPERVAAVMLETYQGGGASFAPPEYIKKLRNWCDKHDVLLIFDEVQATFGRTGRMHAFEHYGVTPDLYCMGKGITSCVPLAAVVGRSDVMDAFAPGTMTSTHTGNPLGCAAALANIEMFNKENVVKQAEASGKILFEGLNAIAAKHKDRIGALHGKGMVAGLHCVKQGSEEPDAELASRVVNGCIVRGLLLFAPVGFGGGTVKISPPLTISGEALREGLQVLEESFEAALK